MNQILSVDNIQKQKAKKSYNGSSEPVEISKVLKFFAIAILVFGVFIIGSGSYSMYKEISSGNSKTKPIIHVETVNDTEISLRISHDSELSRVTYKWNEEQEIEIPSNGKKEVSTTIEIPEGTNALTVYAVDNYGQDIEYRQVYTIDEIITINVQPENNELKITANGANTLTYMTYRWDDEEETKIDINDINVETSIEIPKGLHTLTIIVVDENNKTKTFEQEVNGVTKPKLEVTTDGSSNFVIKASDETGLTRVEFIINETEKYFIDLTKAYSLEDRKEFEYSYPFSEGENKLEVTVYNEDGISETFKARINI